MVSRCTRREIDIQVIFLKHPLCNIMLPSRDFPTAENLSEVPVGNMYPVFMFVWGIDFLYPVERGRFLPAATPELGVVALGGLTASNNNCACKQASYIVSAMSV